MGLLTFSSRVGTLGNQSNNFPRGPTIRRFRGVQKASPRRKTPSGMVWGEALHLFRWLLGRGGAVWTHKIDEFRVRREGSY